MININKWTQTATNFYNLASFIEKYPDREVISFKRVIKNHKYYTKIISKLKDIREEYFRESIILTAYYNKEHFFDVRVSIVNSTKRDTHAYLKEVLRRGWERFLSHGKRKANWTMKITEALESEYIDKTDTDLERIGKPIKSAIW